MQLEWKQPSVCSWVCYDPESGKIHGKIYKNYSTDEYLATTHNHQLGSYINEQYAKQAVLEHLSDPKKANFLTENLSF